MDRTLVIYYDGNKFRVKKSIGFSFNKADHYLTEECDIIAIILPTIPTECKVWMDNMQVGVEE